MCKYTHTFNKCVDVVYLMLCRQQLLYYTLVCRFQKEYPHQWLRFRTQFETKKKALYDRESSTVSLSIPMCLSEAYSKHSKRSLADTLSEKCPLYDVRYKNDRLMITHKAAKRLFLPVIREIQEKINEVLTKPLLNGCKYVIMVGGLSESQLVQESVRNNVAQNVTECDVLIPNDAQLCVVKGAVAFGHRPLDITSRIAKVTYLRDYAVPFRRGYHDPRSRIVFDKMAYSDTLVPVLKQGDEISVGKVTTEILRPVARRQKEMLLQFYTLNGQPKDPQYFFGDDGIRRLKSSVCLNMPRTAGGVFREVEARFKFGGTEIEVELVDRTSGNTTRGMIDLLND